MSIKDGRIQVGERRDLRRAINSSAALPRTDGQYNMLENKTRLLAFNYKASTLNTTSPPHSSHHPDGRGNHQEYINSNICSLGLNKGNSYVTVTHLGCFDYPIMTTLPDTGHHNCRDYYHSLPTPATTHTTPPALSMTQTTAEILRLHSTQKSPLNQRPIQSSFPFLRLPYELRRKIYAYLLPYTETKSSAGSLVSVPKGTSNAASSAHKIHLASLPSAKYTANTTLWHRGQTSLLAVCKQLHSECSVLLYGSNVFVLWLSYDAIQFRFRWVLASGLAPSCTFDFLQLLKKSYLGLVRRVVVTVDVVDEYTGMIKFNVGGSGLVYGLKLQVRKLVRAMKEAEEDEGLRKLTVRLQNGSDGVPEGEKRGTGRNREREVRSIEEVQGVLEPLRQFNGLRELVLCGAITDAHKEELKKSMMANS